MKNKIKVLIVDDHSIVRTGIVSALNYHDQIKVVGEAENGEGAMTALRENKPDIMIVDISLPDITGLELLKKIKAEAPEVKVIIFTMHEDAEYLNLALENGADGYLLKNGELGEIPKAIEVVAAGRNYFSERISYILINEKRQAKAVQPRTPINTKLSPRESEVLKLIVDGQSNKMISSELNISVKTVAIHRTNIMKKVNAKNAADLVRKAIESGLF